MGWCTDNAPCGNESCRRCGRALSRRRKFDQLIERMAEQQELDRKRELDRRRRSERIRELLREVGTPKKRRSPHEDDPNLN